MAQGVYTRGAIYGARSSGDGGVVEALTPSQPEIASTFRTSDYPIQDRAPALVWFGIILGFVILRVASD